MPGSTLQQGLLLPGASQAVLLLAPDWLRSPVPESPGFLPRLVLLGKQHRLQLLASQLELAFPLRLQVLLALQQEQVEQLQDEPDLTAVRLLYEPSLLPELRLAVCTW